MKKTKEAVVFVFAMVLAILMSVPTNADILSSSKATAIIDTQLQSLLKDASADQRIPVDIWLYETSSVEEREEKIYSKIGLDKAQIVSDARGTMSSEKVDEYIMTERSMYATEREQQYESIRKDYANIQGLQDTRSADTRLFYSQYAPMISAELTSAEIKTLARDGRVESICYNPKVTLEDEGNVSIPSIGANYVRDTLGYTGSGVKIGMFETGVPDSSESCFDGVEIIYADIENINSKYKPHATMVAAIMVGQEATFHGVTYGEGIVPDAQLYATCFSPETDDDWRVQIEWLLSQGVHVINMSTYLPNAEQGRYGPNERWVDHIAYSHNVHFVKSSGNNEASVTSPGMAYNILTVGGIDDNNSMRENDDTIYDGSCYLEFSSETQYGNTIIPTNKPDLVAPGVNITTIAGTFTGTSCSAPHVTAVVAQLCQRFPSLRVMQAGVKAMLTASISHSVLAYDTSQGDSIMYDQYGAGVVNAKAVFETANAYRMMSNNFSFNGTSDEESIYYTFTATENQRVRVALTWQKYAELPETVPHVVCDPSDIDLANLALRIIGPNGQEVVTSDTDNCNTEIVDFVTNQSGTYKMIIVNNTPSKPVGYFGLSWWFGEIVDSN